MIVRAFSRCRVVASFGGALSSSSSQSSSKCSRVRDSKRPSGLDAAPRPFTGPVLSFTAYPVARQHAGRRTVLPYGCLGCQCRKCVNAEPIDDPLALHFGTETLIEATRRLVTITTRTFQNAKPPPNTSL